MVKADLGTKRVCPSCGARFYDLSKRPIECPKCQYAFEPESMYKQRRQRPPEPVQGQKPATEPEEEEAEEEAVETVKPIVEPVEGEPGIETGEEEEAEEETVEEPEHHAAGMSVVEGEDPAIEEIEDDVEEDDEDDGLLEEVEEDEDDVSGIIDADIEKDER